MILLRQFLPHIAGGLLLVLAGVSVALWIQTGRLETRTTERDEARAEIEQLAAAATGKDQTIEALEKSNTAWQALATPAAAVTAAADRAVAAAERIEARSAGLTAAEVKDRANPDCAAILAMDLARACPAIAAGVRQRAAGAGLR